MELWCFLPAAIYQLSCYEQSSVVQIHVVLAQIQAVRIYQRKAQALKGCRGDCGVLARFDSQWGKMNMKYRPQGLQKVDKEWHRPRKYGDGTGVNTTRPSHELSRVIEYEGYPRQVLDFANVNHNLLHPTQKPVDLCEYLVRTYTDEGDLVLDFCAGSGSTGVAAIGAGRDFIGFEIDENYFKVLTGRLTCDTI